MYELGRWLRRRYVTDHQLIPPNYSMPEVSVHSDIILLMITCILAHALVLVL